MERWLPGMVLVPALVVLLAVAWTQQPDTKPGISCRTVPEAVTTASWVQAEATTGSLELAAGDLVHVSVAGRGWWITNGSRGARVDLSELTALVRRSCTPQRWVARESVPLGFSPGRPARVVTPGSEGHVLWTERVCGGVWDHVRYVSPDGIEHYGYVAGGALDGWSR